MRRLIAITLSSTLMLQAAPLLAAPATSAAVSTQEGGPTGVLRGTAQTSLGQTLPNYTVRARNLQTGQIAGTTSSNGSGGFSFAGLSPASYVVEVVNEAGAVVGSSAATSVAAGAITTVTVSTTAAAAGAAAGGAAAGGAAAGGAAAGAAAAGGVAAGISTALVVTGVAVAAGIAGVVAVANDASPSR